MSIERMTVLPISSADMLIQATEAYVQTGLTPPQIKTAADELRDANKQEFVERVEQRERTDAAGRRVADLLEAVKDFVEVVICHASFKNCVTESTGTMDEGHYLGGASIDRFRAAIARAEASS